MPTNKKELRDTQEGPTVDELKDRFKAGSIPLQTDFANLIDVAEHGRKAVGKSKGQTGPADGLTLSSLGRLELKLNADGGVKADANGIAVKSGKGIKVDKDGVAVKIYPDRGLASSTNGVWVVANENKGITVDKDGVAVKVGKGINVDKDGVAVKVGKGINVDKDGVAVKVGKGINVDKDGVAVKVGKGIKVDKDGVFLPIAYGLRHGGEGLDVYPKINGGIHSHNDGVSVIANKSKGIKVDKDGVGVKLYPDWGLEHNSEGIWVKVNKSKGVSVDKDGVGVNLYPDWGLEHHSSGIWVKVNKNKGLDVDKDGIGLKPEQILPKGMVMMFAGKEAEMPAGWALCDGKEGRPDLQNKSVLSSTGSANNIIAFVIKL